MKKLKYSIIDVQNFINKHHPGAECLDKVYYGIKIPILVRCEKGHQWQSNWANILFGSWCHICQNLKWIEDNKKGRKRVIFYKYSLEDIQKIAIEKGGVCFSTTLSRKLDFRCAMGHEWQASVGNITDRNSWCPICSSSLYEKICRLYFETIFNKPFPTTYPKWLKNENGNQLELDGYCEELNIAFEHNGKQHYNEVNFRNNSQELIVIQNNDKSKLCLCNEHNVKLIVIPELYSMTKIEDLKQLIFDQANILKIKLPVNFWEINIDHNKVYLSNKEMENFLKLKENLFNAGYELLSTKYLGATYRYTVRCLNCNTIKESSIYNLLSNTCISCLGRKRRNSIEDAQQLALQQNGICLSTEYINNHIKLKWKCNLNHEWEATYNQIQSGEWCPECYKLNRGKSKKLNIDVYQDTALKKGGKCLSIEVNSCYDKLSWQCASGHIWLARGDLIKNTKQWCPQCARFKRKKIIK